MTYSEIYFTHVDEMQVMLLSKINTWVKLTL